LTKYIFYFILILYLNTTGYPLLRWRWWGCKPYALAAFTLYTDCLEIWKPQPPGTLRACPGLQWDCFTFN